MLTAHHDSDRRQIHCFGFGDREFQEAMKKQREKEAAEKKKSEEGKEDSDDVKDE